MPANNGDLKLKEHACNPFRLILRADETIDNVLKPEFWQHIATQLRPGDEIRAVKEDFTLILDLFVIDVSRVSAKVKLLQSFDLAGERLEIDAQSAKKFDLFEVKWGNPSIKYCVHRKEGNVRIQENFADRITAEEWIRNNLQNIT